MYFLDILAPNESVDDSEKKAFVKNKPKYIEVA